MRLLHMLTEGDIARALLNEVFRSFNLNETEARICLRLRNCSAGTPLSSFSLTPTEIAEGLYCGGTRVFYPLIKLMKAKLVEKSAARDPEGSSPDKRAQAYRLTKKGIRIAEQLFQAVLVVEIDLSKLLPKKDFMNALRAHERLLIGKTQRALVSASNLKLAVTQGRLNVRNQQ